jgi:serine/threonine-protein kinase
MAEVCLVMGERSGEAVAKLIPKAPGAKREVLMGDSFRAAGYTNVIRTLDKGEHLNDLVIVMPRAEKSLAKHLEQLGRPLTVGEALPILRDVAAALAAIDGQIVHRDLKPRNVLLLNGSWFVTDFGLARYAADSTAAETRKLGKTPPYTAPEQWREQRATSKTDVYAFGITAHELLTGTWPFPGPDFREQHLRDEAPALPVGSPQLRNLVKRCLMKSPQARPTPAEILERLKALEPDTTVGGGLAALMAANETAVDELAAQHRRDSTEQETADERDQLHRSAVELFEPIGSRLIETIETYADQAKVEIETGGKLFTATLRGAQISLDKPSLGQRRSTAPFDVVTQSAITVRMNGVVQGYEGRSHSLWYCDGREEGQYAWYEVAFRDSGRIVGSQLEPYAISAWQAPPVAFQHVMGTTKVDLFEEIDLGDVDRFVNRWLDYFAMAVMGRLQRPMQRLENLQRWRQ